MPKQDDIPSSDRELGWWWREDLKEIAEKYGRNVSLKLTAALEKEFGPDGKKLEYKERVDRFVREWFRKKNWLPAPLRPKG
jgi:hypothetical protein